MILFQYREFERKITLFNASFSRWVSACLFHNHGLTMETDSIIYLITIKEFKQDKPSIAI